MDKHIAWRCCNNPNILKHHSRDNNKRGMSNIERAKALLADVEDFSSDDESHHSSPCAEQNYPGYNIERAKAKLVEGFFGLHPSSWSDDESHEQNYHLKPALQRGDEVWAAWWDENDIVNTNGAMWHPGTVHAVREVDRFEDSHASNYGPIRVYDIHYEDGDKLNGILDVFVLPKEDYRFQMDNCKDALWKGVRSKVIEFSSDRYAREHGFYAITTLDGEEQIFSTLKEAMKKADEQTILRKNGEVRESDLNLPEECNLLKKKRERSRAGTDNEDNKPKKKKTTTKKELKDFYDETDNDFDEHMDEESEDESTDASFQDDDEGGSRGDSQGGGEQSRYNGVIYIKSTNRYRGIIRINRQNQQLGNYVLGADAANAHDEYCRTMNISDRGFNFHTEKEYKEARSKEINRRQLTLEKATTLAEVTERIQVFKEKWSAKRSSKKETSVDDTSSHGSSNDDLSLPSVVSELSPLVASAAKTSSDYTGLTFTPPVLTEHKQRSKRPPVEYICGASKKIADLNDTLTKKWKIPVDGNVFLNSYQQSLAEMLGASNDKNDRDTSIETNVSISARMPTDVQSDPNAQQEHGAAVMKEIKHGIEQRGLSLHDSDSENENDLNDGEKNEVKYAGVCKLKGKNRFRATLCHNGKQKSMGEYLLKADAAHARDEFCRSFHLNSKALNFNTEEEYENARTKEIAQRRLTMDAADTLAKRKDVISLSEVAARLQEKKAKWREESRRTFIGAVESPQNCKSSFQCHDDSDNAPLISDTKDEQEDFDSTAVTVTASNMTTMKPNWSQMNLVVVTKEQEGSLQFPVGCRVLFNLQDESFRRGVVTKAWFDMTPPSVDIVYEVESLNGESKQKKMASELAFDTRCRVHIKSSETDNASLDEGEVLLSRRDGKNTFYTIQIEKEGNEFQIMHDVPANLVQCRTTHCIDIELPPWLVHDTEAKARLKDHLTGSLRGGKSIFDEIFARTNCTLRITDEDNIVIRMETQAIGNIHLAKIELEDILLNYLNRDNCIGRLFHDLALSCRHLHPQGASSCVYQRNPWAPNEMGYMSVVELPYIGKDFHRSHILAQSLRILSRVCQTGCTMKLVDSSGRYRTRLCDPYVWVWGQQPGDVDEAVKILNDANKEHVKICGRCSMPN